VGSSPSQLADLTLCCTPLPPSKYLSSKKGGKEPHRISGWVKFKRENRRAEDARDSDPIRKARSDAWLTTFRDPCATSEQAIAATNAAELEVRKQLGMSLAIDISKLATDGPDIFPSDARSIEHIPREILDRERKKRS
jgi:hypothetical protein